MRKPRVIYKRTLSVQRLHLLSVRRSPLQPKYILVHSSVAIEQYGDRSRIDQMDVHKFARHAWTAQDFVDLPFGNTGGPTFAQNVALGIYDVLNLPLFSVYATSAALATDGEPPPSL